MLRCRLFVKLWVSESCFQHWDRLTVTKCLSWSHHRGSEPQPSCTEGVQPDVRVLTSGESPSVTEQGRPVSASPGSSSAPFVIIKFSESRFCLSDTSRRRLWKDHFPSRGCLRRESSGEQMCFIREKTAWKGFSKTISFAGGFHYHMWDGGRREGREDHWVNLLGSKIALSNKDILRKMVRFKGQPRHRCLPLHNLPTLIRVYILTFLQLTFQSFAWHLFKGAVCSFGEEMSIRRERAPLADFKQTDHDTIHTVLLCLHVADPATSLASNSVKGPYFPLRTACWFTDGKDFYSYLH